MGLWRGFGPVSYQGEKEKGGCKKTQKRQQFLFPFSFLALPVRPAWYSPHCMGTPPTVSFYPVSGILFYNPLRAFS